MSELRFVIHNRTRMPVIGDEASYLAGPDQTPWPAVWEERENEVVLKYDKEDSPKLHQQFISATGEILTLVTSTLKPSGKSGLLWLELTRGIVDRLRNRVAAWEVNGFQPSASLSERVEHCAQAFCQAVSVRGDVAACETLCISTIDTSLEVIDQAMEEYLVWCSTRETAEDSMSRTLRGAWLGPSELTQPERMDDLSKILNTVAISVSWRKIQPAPEEWDWSSLDEQLAKANAYDWNVMLGPILQFDRAWLPDWIVESSSNFEEVRTAVQNFIMQVVKRCASEVDLCLLATRINRGGDTGWPAASRLQLIVDAAIGLRRVTDQLPFIVGVTQPFSECHAIEDEYPVLHVADGLLRSNIDLAGFALEIEFGTEPGQSWPRDACQLMDRIGQWGMFGLPMVVVTGQGDSLEGDAMSGFAPARLRDFPLWLRQLDNNAGVHAVFWSNLPKPNQDQEEMAEQTALSIAMDWIRDGFGLSR
ncbi:MAG: beta-galactosidase [Pirellulaceae bacterium]